MGINDIFAQFRRVATGLAEVTDADMHNFHHVLANGGFSHNHLTGKGPEGGYMVSLSRQNGGVNHQIPSHELAPHHITEHRTAMEQAGHLGPDVYQGGWDDGDTVHLDVSRNIADRKEAIKQGKLNDQISIWDVAHGQEIPIGGTGNS